MYALLNRIWNTYENGTHVFQPRMYTYENETQCCAMLVAMHAPSTVGTSLEHTEKGIVTMKILIHLTNLSSSSKDRKHVRYNFNEK